MIEQGLYFALGFLVCGLLALATMPAVWSRAHRLTRRELEASLPLSPREIAAGRDQLRAKFAVETRQWEQSVEKANALRHGAETKLGENRLALAGTADQLEARNQQFAALDGEHNATLADLAATRGQLADTQASLLSAQQDIQILHARLGALEQDRQALADVSDQRRIDIAARDTNLEAQRARIDEIDQLLRKARSAERATADQLRQTERQLRDIETERDILLRKLALAESDVQRREAVIAERDGTIGSLIEERETARKAADAMEQRQKDLLARVGLLQDEIAAREQSMARLRDDARQTAQDLTRSIDRLREEKAKLLQDLAMANGAQAAPRRPAGRSDLRRTAPAAQSPVIQSEKIV